MSLNWRMAHLKRVGALGTNTAMELHTYSEKEELSPVMDKPGVVMNRITCRVVMKEMQTSIMLHAYLDWNTASAIIDSLLDMGSGERE